jgi:hypothetical protein
MQRPGCGVDLPQRKNRSVRAGSRNLHPGIRRPARPRDRSHIFQKGKANLAYVTGNFILPVWHWNKHNGKSVVQS